MEPGEVTPPAFKFEFTPNLPLNWRQFTQDLSVPNLLMGQDLDQLTSSHLNFAFADQIADPGFISHNDEECVKSINLMQLAVQYLLYTKQVNINKLHLTQAQHVDLAKHIQKLKTLNRT
jgi:hypothetical protein